MTVTVKISQMTSLMENFWATKHDLQRLRYTLPIFEDNLIQRIALHVTNYILNFSESSIFFSKELFKIESLLSLRKWSQLSEICKLITTSSFNFLDDDEKENLLLGEGLCTAIVINHFKEFFFRASNLDIPHYAQLNIELDENSRVCFFSFQLDKEALIENRGLRFVQAAHKLSCIFHDSKNLQYFSSSVLDKFALRLRKRIPEITKDKRGKFYFYIEDLIPQLKKCKNEKKAYLLGISDYFSSHAIGIYMDHPFHFIDPSYGIGTAESLDELLLFLANYITEKYPQHQTFAILEFENLFVFPTA